MHFSMKTFTMSSHYTHYLCQEFICFVRGFLLSSAQVAFLKLHCIYINTYKPKSLDCFHVLFSWLAKCRNWYFMFAASVRVFESWTYCEAAESVVEIERSQRMLWNPSCHTGLADAVDKSICMHVQYTSVTGRLIFQSCVRCARRLTLWIYIAVPSSLAT